MKSIRLNDLSESARQVLAGAGDQESVVIEDENGQARYGVIPYRKPTEQQKKRAWEKLTELQQKAAAAMQQHGVTEDDLMRVLLEDD